MDPVHPIRRALLSVYDKTGLVEFATELHREFGIELISTGGTARVLREAGLPVTLVEDLTGYPEMLDGRVKTLHPAIHAAILADRDNPEHMRQLATAGIKPIDLVFVNLYPFDQTTAAPGCTFEQAIEMIDIGGVALLRAAAKNHRHVYPICLPAAMHGLLSYLRGRRTGWDEESQVKWRGERAWECLWHVSQYDAQIASWLAQAPEIEPYTMALRALHLEGGGSGALRYGENPHQSAEVLQFPGLSTPLFFQPPASENEPLSYNNYLDADAALGLCAELTRAATRRASGASLAEVDRRLPHMAVETEGRPLPAADGHRLGPGCVCTFIKHTNPCGAAVDADPVEAYRKAYLADPNAAMGGVLAVNFAVDAKFAECVLETYDRFGKPLRDAGAAYAPGGFFVEVWLAPSFSDEAVELIRTRKKWGEKVRLLAVGDLTPPPAPTERLYRGIAGGMLVQSPDTLGLNEEQWRIVTQRAPTGGELADLRIAWLIGKHTKSNAISLVRDGMLIGNGAGQMSRVMSCRIAVWLARENGHAERLSGSVAASDAFFPFRDGPELLIDAGVTAIIQPGGSKRDADTIAACDARGVAMIFTGTRHFRH